jgi:hypothetical protein
VHSDGNADVHDPKGYAVTTHRFARAGRYRVTASHTNAAGVTAVGRVEVEVKPAFTASTRVTTEGKRWLVNDRLLFPRTPLEGLLPNVRMVNATFEDRRRPTFDPRTNTEQFLRALPDYVTRGIRAFTFNLQGGMPGYEGALNSGFAPDGTLRDPYTERLRRVIEACDRAGVAVILGCFYQRQDQELRDEVAVRRAVVETARWIQKCGFCNVLLEISNEFDHSGFNHEMLRTAKGQAELMRLARREAPDVLVSTSGLGHGRYPAELAEVADFLLIHFNGTRLRDIPGRIQALQQYGKPIVCNEDDKTGAMAVSALRSSVSAGASYGLMLKVVNQYQPFRFQGRTDDPVFYDALAVMAEPRESPGSRP